MCLVLVCGLLPVSLMVFILCPSVSWDPYRLIPILSRASRDLLLFACLSLSRYHSTLLRPIPLSRCLSIPLPLLAPEARTTTWLTPSTFSTFIHPIQCRPSMMISLMRVVTAALRALRAATPPTVNRDVLDRLDRRLGRISLRHRNLAVCLKSIISDSECLLSRSELRRSRRSRILLRSPGSCKS
jgi:hypothetical protein